LKLSCWKISRRLFTRVKFEHFISRAVFRIGLKSFFLNIFQEKFPQEWKKKDALQRLCMMRALRPGDTLTIIMVGPFNFIILLSFL
jgi:hypothetical protein